MANNVTSSLTTLERSGRPVNPFSRMEEGQIFLNSAEQIGVTSYVFITLVLIYLLNGLFVCLVAKCEQFHTPYFVILLFHAVYDLIDASMTDFAICLRKVTGNVYCTGYFQLLPFLPTNVAFVCCLLNVFFSFIVLCGI
jgi:hypothetical protein